MTLARGTKLGPYEIEGLIGAGGMGEVWKAKDVRVDRAVALKVLPGDFFEGEERRARFAREAKLLASLNHPGIATLYSFEEISGRDVLTMELVEGSDLAARIASGPLSLEEALPLSRQIAEALAAAHAKGIVHRDLKPANVKVTPDGRVKLLDFGIAKAVQAAPADTHAATATASPTLAGEILGTPAYMSPEQARGEPVDARTDVWAFGCLLCAMVTRRAPFQRRTTVETLAAILGEPPRLDEPEWKGAPALRAVAARCLERDAAKRPASGRALVEALDSGRPATGRGRIPAVLGLAAVVAIAVAIGLLSRKVLGPAGNPASPSPGPTATSAAYALYEKALGAYRANTKADNTRAIALYDEALRIDPKYAPAWAGLAFACARYSIEYFDADPGWAGRAEEASAKALEFGPYLAEAHLARVIVLSSKHQNFDCRRALPEAIRTLELSPNLDMVHFWLGLGYALHLGLNEEAEAALGRAAEINPKWAPPVGGMGWVRMYQGRYEESVTLCRRAAEMSPGFSVNYVTLADALIRLGRDEEAEAALATALEKEPRNTRATSLRAVLAARRGARDEADALIEKAEGLYDDHHVQHHAALVAAARGDAAAAVARLKRTVAGNFNPYGWYARDPLLAGVRDAPAFRAFLDDSKKQMEADRAAFRAALGGR